MKIVIANDRKVLKIAYRIWRSSRLFPNQAKAVVLSAKVVR